VIKDIQELNFPKDGNGKQYATLSHAECTLQDMDEKTVTTQVRIDGDITPDFSKDWEVEFHGEKYIMPLRKPQGAKENTSLNSTIDLTFQHWAVYQLKRWYFFTVQSVVAGKAVPDKYIASVYLNLKNLCNLFGQVLEYYYGDTITIDFNDPDKYANGWEYKKEPTKVDISHSHIWDVLIKFHELYGVRWQIEPNGDTSHYVIKVGYPTTEVSHIWEYGFKGGLLKLERQVQDENIRNMIIGRGGSKNLPYRYFKDVDRLNPTFPADPDWIPELADIPFTELRGATFRSYIQGWNHAHYRRTNVTEAQQAYAPWAWMRGYTDAKFNPVEFVADEYDTGDNGYSVVPNSSIAKYGPLQDGLDNNEDIWPTIQGVTVNGLGCIDEVVEAERIVSDDVEEAVTKESQVSDVGKGGGTAVRVASGNSKRVKYDGKGTFTVPVDQMGVLDASPRILAVLPSQGGASSTHGNRDYLDASTYAEVVPGSVAVHVYNVASGAEHSPSGIPEGTWRYSVELEIHNISEDLLDISYGNENPKLTISTMAKKWGATWNIWIKNIWGTQIGVNNYGIVIEDETTEEYTERVWRPILGDREGNEAKVAFSDGMLSTSEDYEFTIVNVEYDNSKMLGGVQSEWKLTLGKSDADLESLGLYVPNTGRQANAGEHIFFTGIELPHQYVVWAEKRIDDFKKDHLRNTKEIKPTYVVALDKVRIHNYGNPGALTDSLVPGNTLRIADKRFILNEQDTETAYETLYLQSVTYTYNEPTDTEANLLPDVEVVLSDKYETAASPVATLQGEVSALTRQVGSIANIEQIVRLVGDKLYLRKDGIPDRSMSPTEYASLLTSLGFRSGIVGGKGWGFFKDENGNYVLETDRINVRQEMQVNNLVINQITARGGMIVESAAGMVVTSVVDTDSGYVCYFDQKNGTVANLFHVGDVAYCNRFTPNNGRLKFYKRRVMAVDEQSITLTKGYKAVDLPDGTKDTGVNGNGVPEEGDNIIHYGSYTDVSRRFVKVRDVIGGGYERYIEGLDSVNAAGTEYYFVGRQTGMYNNRPRWYIGDAKNYIEWLNGALNIRGRINSLSTIDDTPIDDYVNGAVQDAADKLQSNIDELQKQVDGVIEAFNGFGEPTLSNFPANEWTTDEDRKKHDRDIYTDITPYVDAATTPTSGQSWKWYYNSPTDYGWVKIADSDAVRALELAHMSVQDTDVFYISHTSQTSAPALPTVNVNGVITDLKGWKTTAPAWDAIRYIWQTTYVRRGDGTSAFSDPTCISGYNGNGIDHIEEEYYLSTSRNEPTGSSVGWTDADHKEQWVAGRYWWTRSHIYYTDGSDEVVGEVCVTGETGASAPNLIMEYSATGGSNDSEWHTIYQADDVYMRTSADGGTTWGPAVHIKGSGFTENLVLKSDTEVTTGEYLMSQYTTSEALVVGNKYTFTIWGDLADGKKFGVWDSIGHLNRGYLSKIADGVYSLTLVWDKIDSAADNGFRIYNYPISVTGTSSIHKIKVEKGRNIEPTWNPNSSEMVGQDGQWRKFQWAKNTSTATAPTSGWQDTPLTARPGEYVWMRSGIVVPPATNPAKWDAAVRLTGDKGADGQSVYMLDLSNEVAGISCSPDGTVTGSYPTSQASVYKGSTKVTSGVTYSIVQKTGITTANITSAGLVTMSGLTDNTASMVVQADVSGFILQSTINLYKVKPGAEGEAAVVYSIEPEYNNITVGLDGTVSVANLKVWVYKTTGDSARQPTKDKVLKYQRIGEDNTQLTATITDAAVGTSINVTAKTTAIILELFDTDGTTVLDRERVPLVTDGKKLAEDWAKTDQRLSTMLDDLNGLDYLRIALRDGNTTKEGGLILSSLIKLGSWNLADEKNPIMTKVYAGMNGVLPYNTETLDPNEKLANDRTIASWWGGDMVDRFNTSNKPISPVPADAASALVRMDGTGYFAKGNISWGADGSGYVANGNISWDSLGNVTLGTGVRISLNGTPEGLESTITTILAFTNGIGDLLTPMSATLEALPWSRHKEAKSLRAGLTFWSVGDVVAFSNGTSGGGGEGSGSGGVSYGRLDNWADYVAGSGDVLSAKLGVELHNTLASITGADTDNVINKWQEVVNFLATYTEADTLANLLNNKADKSQLGDYVTLNTVQTITADKITTAQLQKAGASASWVEGRKYALIRTTTTRNSGYNPLWSAKSVGGSWDCGTYLNDILHLSYITDANFNADINSQTADIQFTPYGRVIANSFMAVGGTSSQFLKADGSVDGTAYATAASLGSYNTKSEVNTKLTNGSVTKLGTATVGATNRPIYLKSGTPAPVDSVGEAFLSWGGGSFSANFSPLDAALCPSLGANRFAGAPAEGITVEYTTDGSTWLDYGATDARKRLLTIESGAYGGADFIIGKATSAAPAGPSAKLRITFDTAKCKIYTRLEKLMLNISTSGSQNCKVHLERATNAAPTTWIDLGTYNISGWSGYNVLNIPSFTTYGNTASQSQFIRFTFTHTGGTSSSYFGLRVLSIFGYGGMGWTIPSTLAASGHLYSIDENLNARFTAAVYANTFIGALTGNASTATKLATARNITIGNATRSFNGTANIAYTLADIGAVNKAGDTMTGTLRVNEIQSVNSIGLLTYRPAVGAWSWVNNTQWGVGATDCQGVIRSSDSSLIHARPLGQFTIWDSGNDGSGSGLDADLLDGWHRDEVRQRVSSFEHYRGTNTTGGYDLNTLLQDGGMVSNYGTISYWANAPEGMKYGCAISFKAYDYKDLMGMLAWDINHMGSDVTRGLWWRALGDNADGVRDWGKWHQIAFTDSNVASATKLQTARRIFGNLFDGTKDITGALTNVTTITASGTITTPRLQNATDTMRLTEDFLKLTGQWPAIELRRSGSSEYVRFQLQGGSQNIIAFSGANANGENVYGSFYLEQLEARGLVKANSGVSIPNGYGINWWGGARMWYDATLDAIVFNKRVVSQNDVTAFESN